MSRPSETMWSRRRAAVNAEAKADEKAAVRADADKAQAKFADKSDADILRELNLKDPDQMQAGDDFTSFMLAEVPEHLRRRALRTLWRSNPVLACVDDLLEYGDDFKAEWSAAGVVRTAYRVGKGMLSHVDEMEKQRLAEQAASPDRETDTEAESEAETQADADVAEPDVAIATVPEAEPLLEPLLEPVLEPMPEPDVELAETRPARRMRFEFDGVS